MRLLGNLWVQTGSFLCSEILCSKRLLCSSEMLEMPLLIVSNR